MDQSDQMPVFLPAEKQEKGTGNFLKAESSVLWLQQRTWAMLVTKANVWVNTWLYPVDGIFAEDPNEVQKLFKEDITHSIPWFKAGL